MNVVEAVRLVRRYRGPAPVDGLDLRVEPGEVVGVHGPSGTGKSTLLRLLAGLERPDAGTLTYGDRPAWVGHPSSTQPALPRPGYVMPVFQDPFASLDPRWPVWRSITEPLTVGARPTRAERFSAAQEWLDAARLDVPLDARPGELSGGQCQRVALVRALAARPALLVADEPTARQDVVTAAALADLVRRMLPATSGAVVVSHDRRWLATVATRVLSMADGRLHGGGGGARSGTQ